MSVSNAPRRSGAATGLAVVALLAVIGIVAFVLLSNQKPTAAEPSPSPTGTPIPTPEPTLDEALLSARYTVLIVGKDHNAGRDAAGDPVNTDTIMLASVNADQSEVTLISVPRDTVDLPLPDGGTWQTKINGLYGAQGIETLVGAMAALFETEIDGYVAIDMDDLELLVDAVGGVDVEPAAALVDPKVHLDLAAGPQTLDGATALAYVRTRVDTDYGRAARQQEVVLEVVRRLIDPDTDLDIRAILDTLDGMQTDLPLDKLPTLVELAHRAEGASRTLQVLQPPEFITFEGDAGDGRGYVLVPDIDAIRAFAAEHLGD
jgi:LCP family protein required for cell wall assembly